MTFRVLLVLAALTTAACSETVVYDPDLDPYAEEPPCPPAAGHVLITNSGDDTVTLLDAVTLTPACTVPVGRLPPEREAPHHGASSLDGTSYFVGLSNFLPGGGGGPHGDHGTGTVPGYLLRYRSSDHVLLGEARVDRSPGDVRLTPDGSLVLQSHFDLVRITEFLMGVEGADDPRSALAIIEADFEGVIDPPLVPVCPAAHGIAIAPDSSKVWVTCYATDEIAEVTLTPPYDVRLFPVGPAANPELGAQPAYGPYAVSVHDDGTLWVSCVDSREIRVVDPATEAEVMPAISFEGSPFFGSFNADGSLFVIPHQGDDRVSFVDTATGAVAQLVDLPDPPDLDACTRPHAAVFTPDDQRVLVVCEGDHLNPGSVAVVDATNFSVSDVSQVGVYPDDAVWIGGAQ